MVRSRSGNSQDMSCQGQNRTGQVEIIAGKDQVNIRSGLFKVRSTSGQVYSRSGQIQSGRVKSKSVHDQVRIWQVMSGWGRLSQIKTMLG